jgi:2-dehydropantoate 2-reductase
VTETVGILGPGAVGGAFAAHLLNAHQRVVCVGPPETVGLIALAGIALEMEGKEPLTVRPQIAERLWRPVSLLLVTVKAPYLEDALERVDPVAVEDAVVLPLLNGLEHMEPIREHFNGRVAAGSLSRFEAYRVGRMQVIQRTPGAVVTMASKDLPESELEKAAGILRSAKIEVGFDYDEKRVLWRKLARLSVLSAATALSRKTVGDLRTDPEWRPRMEAALEEACAVANADGVKVIPSAQWTRIVEMDRDLTTSAARDVAAGKPSEIDAIGGSVVRAGERLGVPCPVLSELVAEASAL